MPDLPSPASARERTVGALVAAATELFAERGPDAVSLREVAARAGLNYGLIHQQVGSKEDLLRLVIQHVTSSTAANFEHAGDAEAALELLLGTPSGAPLPYSRMIAWAILQGRDPKELAGPSPALPKFIEMLPPLDTQDELIDDPRIRAASVVALTLGWKLFGEFLMHAAGIDDVPLEDMQATVRAIARGIAGI